MQKFCILIKTNYGFNVEKKSYCSLLQQYIQKFFYN